LFCPGEGTRTLAIATKDAEANLRNQQHKGSLMYLWSECKQKVASLCTGCNQLQLKRNRIQPLPEQFRTELVSPKSFNDSEHLDLRL